MYSKGRKTKIAHTYRRVTVFLPFGVPIRPLNKLILIGSVAARGVTSTHCTRCPFLYVTSFWISTTRTWGGGDKGADYCHHSPLISFSTATTCNRGDCSENLRWYISTSCSAVLVIYRLSSSRSLAIRARAGRLLASPALSVYSWLSSQA